LNEAVRLGTILNTTLTKRAAYEMEALGREQGKKTCRRGSYLLNLKLKVRLLTASLSIDVHRVSQM
jgi:hypothetical protein